MGGLDAGGRDKLRRYLETEMARWSRYSARAFMATMISFILGNELDFEYVITPHGECQPFSKGGAAVEAIILLCQLVTTITTLFIVFGLYKYHSLLFGTHVLVLHYDKHTKFYQARREFVQFLVEATLTLVSAPPSLALPRAFA